MGISARLPRSVQFGPKQRWTRYSPLSGHSAPGCSSPGNTSPQGNGRRYGVPDQAVIVLADLMEVALKGESPVGRRPLRDVGHLLSDRLRRDGIGDRQDDLRRNLDPEWIVLRRLLRIATLPDPLVAFEVRRLDGDDSAEGLAAGQVIDDLVSWLHSLRLLAVSRLESLDGEAVLFRAHKVIG